MAGDANFVTMPVEFDWQKLLRERRLRYFRSSSAHSRYVEAPPA
jgi:hypothetical protein